MPTNLDRQFEGQSRALAEVLVDIKRDIQAGNGRATAPILEEIQKGLRVSKDALAKISQVEHRIDRFLQGRTAGPDLLGAMSGAIVCQLRAWQPDPVSSGVGLLNDRIGASRETALDLAKRDFAGRQTAIDDLPRLVKRAATVPVSTSDSAWAGVFAEIRNSPLLALAQESTYARLSRRGLRVDLSGIGGLRFVTRAASPTLAGSWLAENQPIPVGRLSFSTVELSTRKLAIISFYSAEMLESSTPNIEAIVRATMVADTQVVLDSTMLDATAGSTARPPGLRYGISPLTAAAGGGAAALAADFSALAAAISSPQDLCFLMHPADALRARIVAPGLLTATIIEAPVLSPGVVIAIDCSDLATAENDAPRISVSEQATLHADTAPLPIATGAQGSGVLATPSYNMWQQNLLAVRMLVHVGWQMRRANRISWTETVTW